MTNQDTILSIKNLHKQFGGRSVLKDINLDIKRGEILGFFGLSGTGKSVILRSIVGLEKPDSGEVFFEDQNIISFSEAALVPIRKKIAYVFQNGALFDSKTVEENIAYPLLEHTQLTHAEIKKRVAEMLKLIGLEGSERLYPSNLSGGMQKRVGVARSIILKPEIILYDEPTAGLDPFNTNRLVDLMSEVRKLGNSAIFVTHDLPAAFRVVDRIAFLFKGVIHAIDTTERIRASKDPVIQSFLKGEEIK